MRRLAAAALTLGLGLMAAGCFNPFAPLISRERVASSPAPVPNSPANAVKLFEWCWNNRAFQEYQELFTDDYRFIFATNDSAGNPYQGRPYTREDEMATAANLFNGGSNQPPAKSITLNLDRNLIALNDPRPGKLGRWHKSIRTHVDLKVEVDHGDGATEFNTVQGFALFFIVRGDSAAIPPELVAKGFHSDSTRWWIERWEDETLPEGGGGPAPQTASGRAGLRPAVTPATGLPIRVSMGRLKVSFR